MTYVIDPRLTPKNLSSSDIYRNFITFASGVTRDEFDVEFLTRAAENVEGWGVFEKRGIDSTRSCQPLIAELGMTGKITLYPGNVPGMFYTFHATNCAWPSSLADDSRTELITNFFVRDPKLITQPSTLSDEERAVVENLIGIHGRLAAVYKERREELEQQDKAALDERVDELLSELSMLSGE